jgi:hypothetical protein
MGVWIYNRGNDWFSSSSSSSSLSPARSLSLPTPLPTSPHNNGLNHVLLPRLIPPGAFLENKSNSFPDTVLDDNP